MRKLARPVETAGDVFTTCISNYNEPLKSKLLAFKSDVVTAATLYDDKAVQTLLHTIKSDTTMGGKVSKEEMTNVYNHKMARKGQPGRVIYDKIFSSSPNDMCPLCGYRIVATLDHYLPESKFPVYAVTPSNLVPSCTDCNKIKTALTPSNTEEETIHPYFDDFEDHQWLFAEVVASSPASVIFKANPPDGLSEALKKRIRYHFKVYKLGALYGTYAAGELLNIRFKLNGLFSSGGSKAVQKRLIEDAVSCNAANINSWQTAMYMALSKNEWFCSGGFNN